ncbi:thioesterase superfamily [Micractinium conductrix]|uniref:Thioesterase superfamily n=1 Tax=Micractinium conductrix TaxID=554055 RepID=A0A2P6V0T4_9CHLO|nr:thioesterase superfamily [Micractinium conductrix]|eukprot:PSC67699.1 thioesterase superfamily [Micractinium conductrix]
MTVSHGEDLDPKQPGGGLEQRWDVADTGPAPLQAKANSLAATAAGYREKVLADGIPFRPHGLFPPQDPLLAHLSAEPKLHPFEKHVPGTEACYQVLPSGGWASGDTAAANGVDMRLFYQEPEAGETHGRIVGAVRFGTRASIAVGFGMSAHGGSIETALDEATAELAKLCFEPVVSTRQATFNLIRPVPLHTSLLVTCTVKEVRGIRCFVTGDIRGVADAGGANGATAGTAGAAGTAAIARPAATAAAKAAAAGEVLATCEAMLVDIKAFL